MTHSEMSFSRLINLRSVSPLAIMSYCPLLMKNDIFYVWSLNQVILLIPLLNLVKMFSTKMSFEFKNVYINNIHSGVIALPS